MKTAIRLCFIIIIIIFTFFFFFLHTLILPYNSFLTKCFSLGRKWKKLAGMRNLIVICANQMDLIRICRYLSYFHGSSLVVFSSKFVRESIFTNVPPLETATTNSCCISTPKIKLFILVKNGNQTEWSVTKNFYRHRKISIC